MTNQEFERDKENLNTILNNHIKAQQDRINFLHSYVRQLKSIKSPKELQDLKGNIFMLLNIKT